MSDKCPRCGGQTKILYDYGFGVTLCCIECRHTFDIEEPQGGKCE